MDFPWLTPPVRRWIYGVCAAIGALAVGVNWAGEHTVALIMAVIASILTPAVAIPHVPITEIPVTDNPLPPRPRAPQDWDDTPH